MAKTILCALRSSTPISDDIFNLSQRLNGAGYTFLGKTGSLAAEDFSQYEALIIEAPGTDLLLHVDSDILDSFPIPIISFCRATSVVSLGISTDSVLASTNWFVRVDDTDPRNVWDAIPLPVGDRHTLANPAAGTTVHYHPNSLDYIAVAERIGANGHRRVHFGAHDWNNGLSDATFQLLMNYLPDPDFTYDVEIVDDATEELVLLRTGVRRKETLLYNLDPLKVYRGRARPVFRGKPGAWPPSIIFDVDGLIGLDLVVQEQGHDTFSATGELGGLPITVQQFALQEQGQDIWGAAPGSVQPVRFEVEYWDQSTPGTVNYLSDIEEFYAVIPSLQPETTYCYRVRAYYSESFQSDWSEEECFTTPLQSMWAQETGDDIFVGQTSNQYLQAQEQGLDVFSGTGELGAAAAVANLEAQEEGQDTLEGSAAVAISCNMAAQEVGQDTPTATVTVTVTAVLSTQEELYDVLAAAGAVAVAAALEAQEEGQDTFSGTMEEITVGVPDNLRVTAATRTSLRFEWDEPV